MQRFSAEFNEGVAHQLEQTIAEGIRLLKQRILFELLDTFRSLLPSYVVRIGDNQFELMIYLGNLNGSNLFYHEKLGIYKQNNQAIPLPPLVEKIALSQSQIEGIVPIISETISKKSPPDKIVVPPGFFVFQFCAQWTGLGCVEPFEAKIKIVEAPSLEEAIKKLKNVLAEMRENCFEDFIVYQSQDKEWKKLIICSERYPHTSIVKCSNLCEAEFILAE